MTPMGQMCRVDAVLTLLAAKGYHCAINSFRSRLVGKGAALSSTAQPLRKQLGVHKAARPDFILE